MTGNPTRTAAGAKLPQATKTFCRVDATPLAKSTSSAKGGKRLYLGSLSSCSIKLLDLPDDWQFHSTFFPLPLPENKPSQSGGYSARLYKRAAGIAIDHLSGPGPRSEEHTSELQSRPHLVCRLL